MNRRENAKRMLSAKQTPTLQSSLSEKHKIAACSPSSKLYLCAEYTLRELVGAVGLAFTKPSGRQRTQPQPAL
jgi:hypothetical protein